MKFTLRHALTLLILAGVPSAITTATGGEPTPLELIRAIVAVFGGGILSLWVYNGLKPKVLAPAWMVLPGAVALLALSAVCGYVLEGSSLNLCKHCGATRTTYHLWICQVCFTQPSNIEALFHYHCAKHEFARLSQNTPLYANQNGDDDTPIVFQQNEQVLAKLALLRPIEKCHVLFEQTNKLDRTLKDVREIAFGEFEAVVSLPEARNLTEAEAVEIWWKRFGPVMQPAKTTEDLDRMRDACANDALLLRMLPKVVK